MMAALAAGAVVLPAQEKFPLKPGEWTRNLKVAGAPNGRVIPYCLNDEYWMKAFNQSLGCTVKQLGATPAGMVLSVECQNAIRQVKGTVQLTYDGMEHMTEKSTFQLTTNGNTNKVETVTDWRWKGPTCGPADINTRALPTQPPAAK
jgi:hypothetical protein